MYLQKPFLVEAGLFIVVAALGDDNANVVVVAAAAAAAAGSMQTCPDLLSPVFLPVNLQTSNIVWSPVSLSLNSTAEVSFVSGVTIGLVIVAVRHKYPPLHVKPLKSE